MIFNNSGSLPHSSVLITSYCLRSKRKCVLHFLHDTDRRNGSQFPISSINTVVSLRQLHYRSGTVNSKSFVGKVFLRIKWKFELTVFELTVYEEICTGSCEALCSLLPDIYLKINHRIDRNPSLKDRFFCHFS